MRGMNKVVLCGRLGNAPELKQSKSGMSIATFSLATERAKKDGDTWVSETDWHSVVAFKDNAEKCHKYLQKGYPVIVEGSLQYEKYTDKEGIKRTFAKILVDRVHFLPRPATATATPAEAPVMTVAPLPPPPADEIPF